MSRPVRLAVAPIVFCLAFVSVNGQDKKAAGASKRMADGKMWMTRNLDVDVAPA